MPRGVLGLNAPMFKGYLRFIANRRAQQIGLEPMFAQEKPISWMHEITQFLRHTRYRTPLVFDDARHRRNPVCLLIFRKSIIIELIHASTVVFFLREHRSDQSVVPGRFAMNRR